MGNNQQLTDQLLNHLVIRFLNRKCHNHLQSRKNSDPMLAPCKENQHEEDVLPLSNYQTFKRVDAICQTKIAGKPKIEACGS